jgi:hypothetical protein
MHTSSDLLSNLEDDLEFYWQSERKTGNTDDQPNRHLIAAKDISKQVRGSIRDSGLVEEVS